ncbi:hypothetical protein LUZ63_007780 [Rhynchospora breviuscula]|uniref:Uncharacterized protein n=1 Tax=Rhynchospora breviuscula TaxID=2022672 RepID=A0A9Q0HVD6_9POAL|nr:hypothetical protein LUZ63_007780 [Rhynchospora breviuscula]
MGSRGKILFDLNELPTEEEFPNNSPATSHPPKSLPIASKSAPDLPIPARSATNLPISSGNALNQPIPSAVSNQGMLNNHAFKHASTGSLFQPFVRNKDPSSNEESKPANNNDDEIKSADREEGEWSDIDGNTEAVGSNNLANEEREADKGDSTSNPEALKDGSVHGGDAIAKREVKGVEASYALKFANNPMKRPRIDEQKEEKLGKRRPRQTVFINVEDAKQAGPMKGSTPKRQTSFPAPIITRTVKEKQTLKQSDVAALEGTDIAGDQNGDLNGDSLNSSKSGSWKQPVEPKQLPKGTVGSSMTVPSKKMGSATTDLKFGNGKKHMPSSTSKKQLSNSTQYQDTSVERLIREVTSEKFWHNAEEAELQCVPGSFESVEEYVRVFEPLLFEECRAQLYSTYEELLESVSRDAYFTVRVKTVERRERGWYDIVLIPTYECKWNFKEGDVAVLTSSRPGSVQASRSSRRASSSNDDLDLEANSGRLTGTVRRHTPIDTRDPPGAIFHFYVGDLDSSSKMDENHILRKLQPKSMWYLSVLGTLATTQREYVALHAFRRLNVQMQTAILKPSPEHFPKYEEQSPSLPDCFTENFVDHLHRSFNGPQLSAIQWAATHTAAGTSNGTAKRQDPWPFTLVQGPPGTGKTHTVWGMLNVIHLVQYQHYYAALLKKLAPESYKQLNGAPSTSEPAGTGSIDEVLQSMDQNLFRTLPKLCPKPRMLVCAPSNAATDELLSRVLERGFIDGEMKLYRPDVARVGVDSQSRAAQAVSVERRTEQLLMKGRDEVIGWLHQLKAREQQLSQQITLLQRELSVAAAHGRSQGSVGVDPEVLAARDHNRDVLLQNLAAAVENRDKVLVEMSRLLLLEARFRPGSNFNLEETRANLEVSFANEAEIVFTTVSSSGRKLFSRLNHGFDMVVIDEAAQASEVAVLPPLSLGAARCVLVGDPQQLPATVISKAAGTLMYSRSLFERFQQAGCPTMLLSVQYRMHPQIRDFPSRYFYQGRLTDSDSVLSLPDETYYRDLMLKPYVFYDITHGRESHRGGSASFQNIHEAQFALKLYDHLQKFVKANGGGKKVTVGIITPYKLQLKCLQREFEEVLGTEEGKDIYINTVDAFQGQERDVIIMSCVRASNHGVGFVADIRRMNVALTRARRALWIVGNANALMQSDDWAALIEDAKSRKCFMDMDSIPKEFLNLGRVSSSSTSIKSSNNIRGFRSRPGMKPDFDEERHQYLPRNGSYRHLDDRDREPPLHRRTNSFSSNISKRDA